MITKAIAERLAAIEEELRDLAYERLRDAARDPDSDEGVECRARGEAVSCSSPRHRQGDQRACGTLDMRCDTSMAASDNLPDVADPPQPV